MILIWMKPGRRPPRPSLSRRRPPPPLSRSKPERLPSQVRRLSCYHRLYLGLTAVTRDLRCPAGADALADSVAAAGRRPSACH